MILEVPKQFLIGANRLYVEHEAIQGRTRQTLWMARDMFPDFQFPFSTPPQGLFNAVGACAEREGSYSGDRFIMQSFDCCGVRYGAIMYGGHTPHLLTMLRGKEGLYELMKALRGNHAG